MLKYSYEVGVTMIEIIKENERKIDKFDVDFYLKNKNYSLVAALKALDTTNEIQKAYFKNTENLSKEEHILRLYALLQGLFVSVDSLYSLALSLTKSKSYININSNASLRQLRYIRNDVVGHPSNRVLNSDVLAYCILDNDSITLESFSYKIYTPDEIIERVVDINEILNAYYKEANSLLDELYSVAKTDLNKSKLEVYISNAIDNYILNRDYIASLNEFIDEYKKMYKTAKGEQHRALFRYELINKLNEFPSNEFEKEIVDYCIGIELAKIYVLIKGANYSVTIRKTLPDGIAYFYRFMNKNKDQYYLLDYLLDSSNPLYLKSIVKLKDLAYKKGFKSASNYLDMIYKAYISDKLDIAYGLALPIKEYKRKK